MQGQTESDLTPLGRLQAAAMGELLSNLIDRSADWRIVASPLRRARHTAEAIGQHLGLPVAFDERLLEIDVGDWSGRLWADLMRESPELFADHAWGFRAPNGETYEGMMARLSGWLAEQSAEADRRLIVVSHGFAGRLLRGAYAGLSQDDTLAQDVPQDAIFRLAGGQIERLACAPVSEPA